MNLDNRDYNLKKYDKPELGWYAISANDTEVELVQAEAVERTISPKIGFSQISVRTLDEMYSAKQITAAFRILAEVIREDRMNGKPLSTASERLKKIPSRSKARAIVWLEQKYPSLLTFKRSKGKPTLVGLKPEGRRQF